MYVLQIYEEQNHLKSNIIKTQISVISSENLINQNKDNYYAVVVIWEWEDILTSS